MVRKGPLLRLATTGLEIGLEIRLEVGLEIGLEVAAVNVVGEGLQREREIRAWVGEWVQCRGWWVGERVRG